MKWNVGSPRLWLFRGLVAIAAGLIIASFILPWWRCDIVHEEEGFSMKLFQHGIHGGAGSTYYFQDITAFYQTVLAWIYLAASVGLILYSTWLKKRRGRWLLGGIGFINVIYAVIAVIWIAIRTSEIGIPLQGYRFITETLEPVDAYTSLQFGYYLAHASGLVCIALALLRNRIIGGGYAKLARDVQET